MSDEAAFLAALKANPADDLTRLVYADWLDERDELAKGQYLRAVVDLTWLAGGTPEYNDAAVRLYTACLQADPAWRKAAGTRFDVVLEGYADKIYAIKVIREITAFGLAEAKAMAESVPTPLFSWLPFEESLPRLLAFHRSGDLGRQFPVNATIRPTPWPDGSGQGAIFDVLLGALNFDVAPETEYRLDSAIRGVATLLGWSTETARAALANLPLVLASGLAPTAVAEYVQRVKRTCNVYSALPADAIRVVPRLPNQ